MRNLTTCLIAFAVAFSATAIVFHSVIAANHRIERRSGAVPMGPSARAPESWGVPAVRDDLLF